MLKEMLDCGLTLEQIQREVEKEYREYYAKKATETKIKEARDNVVQALADYALLLDPSVEEEHIEMFMDKITKELTNVENVVSPSHKRHTIEKPKARIRVLGEDEAAKVLEDFLKGLN